MQILAKSAKFPNAKDDSRGLNEISSRWPLQEWHSHWEGGQGWGDGDTGIRGAGDGGKGCGDGGKGGGGTGEEGAGVGKFWGRGLYQNLLYFTDFTLFFVLQCNNWVSEVSNRRIEVNSGIFAMNPELISLHWRGVFRQLWFTLNSFTSDFGLSLVDYFPLIPKVHKIAVVGGNPHF